MKLALAPIRRLVLLAALGTACASYPGEELPARRAAELEGLAPLPALTFEVQTYRAAMTAGSVDPLSRIEPLLRRACLEARRVSSPGERGPLHLDLLVREAPRNPGISLALGLLWLGSLGIVPAYARDDLLLDARLVRGEETLARHVYTDHVATWLSIVLLPWSFSRDPEHVHGQVLDGMVLALIADLRRDLVGEAPRPAAER